jgi:hypothetical protein
MLFNPQKLDTVLKRIHYHLSSESTIRYRRAEVLAKVLLSIDILIFPILCIDYCSSISGLVHHTCNNDETPSNFKKLINKEVFIETILV